VSRRQNLPRQSDLVEFLESLPRFPANKKPSGADFHGICKDGQQRQKQGRIKERRKL